jgi:hypothetical protein
LGDSTKLKQKILREEEIQRRFLKQERNRLTESYIVVRRFDKKIPE